MMREAQTRLPSVQGTR